MRIWGEQLLASQVDGSSVALYQSIVVPTNHIIKGIRSKFVFYNDPTFTSIKLRVYHTLNVNSFICDSEAVTKAEIMTLSHSFKEIFFELPEINMRGTDTYYIIPIITGYTDNWPSSGIAWAKAWPDPVYREGFTPSLVSIATDPYDLHLVGVEK